MEERIIYCWQIYRCELLFNFDYSFLGFVGTAFTGLPSVRGVRNVHDMVRRHHHQPRPDVHEWCSGRWSGGHPRPAGLSVGARPVPALHTQRLVDNHQPAVCVAHVISSAQAAQGLDQSERRSR